MEHTPTVFPLQKALTFVLAMLVSVLVISISFRLDSQGVHERERNAYVGVSSFLSRPGFPSVPGSFPKLNFVLFALAGLWSLLLLLKAHEVQKSQASGKGFFLQEVQFVFVSTKAP